MCDDLLMVSVYSIVFEANAQEVRVGFGLDEQSCRSMYVIKMLEMRPLLGKRTRSCVKGKRSPAYPDVGPVQARSKVVSPESPSRPIRFNGM